MTNPRDIVKKTEIIVDKRAKSFYNNKKSRHGVDFKITSYEANFKELKEYELCVFRKKPKGKGELN